MLDKDLVMNKTLRILNRKQGEDSTGCRMGVVVARAGLGKTAILVQIALDNIFHGRRVLHVSVGEGLEKARAWYDDMFLHVTSDLPADRAAELAEHVQRNRMIMTFKEAVFSRPKLEERLNDLVYQDIFRPDCVVVDGFDFSAADFEEVADVKDLMSSMNLQVWFSALSHRDDERVSKEGVPAPCHEIAALFETVIVLKPEPPGINLHVIKDETACVVPGKVLALDPASMTVREG